MAQKQNNRGTRDSPRTWQWVKRGVHFLLGLAILGGLIAYLIQHWDRFAASLQATPAQLVTLGVCVFLTLVVTSLQLLLLMRTLGLRVGFFENLALLMATSLANHLPMRVGTLLRLQYFHRVHGLHFAKFSGMQTLRVFVLLGATGLLGCVGVVALRMRGHPVNLAFLVTSVGLMLFCLLAAMLKPPAGDGSSRIIRVWSTFWQGFSTLRGEPRLLLTLFGLTLLQLLLVSVRLHISFAAMGRSIDPWAMLLVVPVTVLSAFVAVTPANLGLREWLLAFLSSMAGQSFEQGIFAGTLDRAVLLAINFSLGSVGLFWVLWRSSRTRRRS